MIDTWAKFVSIVKLAEMRIDREYTAAVRSGDDEGQRTASGKYAKLNALLEDVLISLRELNGARAES